MCSGGGNVRFSAIKASIVSWGSVRGASDIACLRLSACGYAVVVVVAAALVGAAVAGRVVVRVVVPPGRSAGAAVVPASRPVASNSAT